MILFNGFHSFVETLKKCGFKEFGPGHSASNGYDLLVNDKGRRACFYDVRIFKQPMNANAQKLANEIGIDLGEYKPPAHDIEFRVMDYSKSPTFKKMFCGLYRIEKYDTRYCIFSLPFLSHKELTEDKIRLLIDVSKFIE